MALKVNGVTVIDDSRNVSLNNLATIEVPRNLSPANGEINVFLSNTLIISPYSHAYGIDGTFSEFQVSNNYAFTDIYYSTGNLTSLTTTITIPVQLSLGSTYYWRARYACDEEVFDYSTNTYANVFTLSNFSDITSFTTTVFEV